VAVLGGVHTGRPVLTAAGAWLVGAVVLAHAIALGARIGRALTGPLAGTVWFYVAASAALLAGRGLGVRLAGGGPASTDAYRAMRLAHSHLNVLGWVGLAVVGTQFTLWPTVLRTRMVPGVGRAVRWSLATMVMGLAAATAGLLGQARVVVLAGLAG
jgi:nitrite reductase (NO-forming)